MNDAQILADLVARRGAAWVTAALEIIDAVSSEPAAAPMHPEVARAETQGRHEAAFASGVLPVVPAIPEPVVDLWDPAINPDVEARGPGWVKWKRGVTHTEALAADPDRDFGNGPGVQVDADGNVVLAPIPPMPYVEPTIDFRERAGANDPTGYAGYDPGPSQ